MAGFAMVLVRHPAKSGMGSAIHRGLGSIDFIGAARTGFFVQQHPLHLDMALLCQSKNNLGPLGRTQVFTKGQDGFHWRSITRLSAETLAGSGRGPDPISFLEASFWLEQRLEGGLQWSAADILTEGEEEGHTKKVLYKAKKALGAVAKQQNGSWYWRLPAISMTPMPDMSTTHSIGVTGVSGGTGATGLTGVSEAVTDADIPPTPDAQVTTENPDLPVSPVVHAHARETPFISGAREEVAGHDAAEEELADLMPSSLCPQLGRHNLIKGAKGWECTKCRTPFKTHPGCHTLGLEHTLAIRDGQTQTKERYCTLCGMVTESWEQCPDGNGREQDVPDPLASGTPDDPTNMRSVPDVPDVLQDQEQTVSRPHRVPETPPPCPHDRLEVQDGDNVCLDCGEVIDVWVF